MSEATQAPPAAGSFCWNELMTRDASKAISFFTELFGWTTEEMPMPEAGGVYTMFKNGDTHVGGCMQMDGPQFENVPPHWMTYVAVDDVDATAEKVKSLGGTVLHGPADVPNMGRFAVLQDPTGATISVWKSTTQC